MESNDLHISITPAGRQLTELWWMLWPDSAILACVETCLNCQLGGGQSWHAGIVLLPVDIWLQLPTSENGIKHCKQKPPCLQWPWLWLNMFRYISNWSVLAKLILGFYSKREKLRAGNERVAEIGFWPHQKCKRESAKLPDITILNSLFGFLVCCLFVFSSFHPDSDQISQWSQVSKLAHCVQILTIKGRNRAENIHQMGMMDWG